MMLQKIILKAIHHTGKILFNKQKKIEFERNFEMKTNED